MKKKVCLLCQSPMTEHRIAPVRGALEWVCPPLKKS